MTTMRRAVLIVCVLWLPFFGCTIVGETAPLTAAAALRA